MPPPLVLSSGALGGVAPELLLGLGLGGPLGAADGAGTGNGSLPKVTTVARLGGLVGDGLVGPGYRMSALCTHVLSRG